MARPFAKLEPNLIRLGPPPSAARAVVLFLHGAWHGAWCWAPLDERLAELGYGVSLLELPGHGRDRWELPWGVGLNDYADLARRAAASLGRPALIAHSMGGWLAQKILETMDLPALLLAPLPSGGLPKLAALGLMARDWTCLPGLLVGRPLAIKDAAMTRRLFFRNLDPELVQAFHARLVPEPWRAACERGRGRCTARARPGRSPRMLAAGGQDYFMPVGTMRRLADRLGAEFRLLPGRPHATWMEDPDGAVLSLAEEFMLRAEKDA